MVEIAIAAVVGAVSHMLVRRFALACLVAAVISPVLLAIEEFIRLQLPPAKIFWLPIQLPIWAVQCGIVAMIVGVPLRNIRLRKKINESAYRPDDPAVWPPPPAIVNEDRPE